MKVAERRRLMVLICVVVGVLGLALGTGTAAARPGATTSRPARTRNARVTAFRSHALKLRWTNPHSSTFAGTTIVVVRGTRPARHVGDRGRTLTLSRHRHGVTVHGLTPGTHYSLSLFATNGSRRYARPVSVEALTAPAPVSHVHTYQVSSGASVHWQNPAASTFDHVVVRYARGYTAPTRSTLGRRVSLTGRQANLAHLTGLADDTVYTTAVWTVDAQGHRSTPVKRTFTSGAMRGPRGVYVGRVVDDQGHPLLNAEIQATNYTGYGTVSSTATTDVDGRFRLPLVPGSWFADFGGQHISGGDADPTGYVGAENDLVVHPGQTVHAGNVVLTPGGAVTGVVTDLAGHPLAGAQAEVDPVQTYISVDSSGDGIFAVVDFGDSDTIVSGADGRYTIKGVPLSMALRVCLTTTSQPVTGGDSDAQGYADRCLPSGAAVRSGVVQSEPALALDGADGGTISGRVTTPSGSGLNNWFVSLDPISDPDANSFAGDATTAPDGSFTTGGLLPGTYRVCAETGQQPTSSRTGFTPGCHAGVVTVRAGATTTADVQLAVGAAVTGKVTGPRDVPIGGVDVDIQSRRAESGAFTDATGHYRVEGLPTGEQITCFQTDQASAHRLPTGAVSACYGHRTHFAARAGAVRNGVDIRLPAGAAVSGTVRDTDGKPVPFVDVEVEPVSFRDDKDGGFAATDAAGHYVVRGLSATSKYRVCFLKFDADLSQISSCRHGRLSASRGHITRGVNGVLRLDASIAVTVDDTAGHPVAGVDATALAPCPERGDCDPEPLFSSQTGVLVDASNTTNGAGVAALRSLKPGRYAVCLFAYFGATTNGTPSDGYADRCSGSTFTVTVRADKTTAVHETLSDGGAVSGTVTDGAGHGLGGVYVHVSHGATEDYDGDYFPGEPVDPLDGDPVSDIVTRADGSYTIRGVQPGMSTVCADATQASGPDAGGYFDQCLGGKVGSHSGGTGVAIAADLNRAGTDLALTPASGISGRITTTGGDPESEAEVIVFAGHTEHEVADVQPGDDGAYTVTQLPAGSYSVCAESFSVNSPAECYRNLVWKKADEGAKPPLAATTLVTTTVGTANDGIDLRLHE